MSDLVINEKGELSHDPKGPLFGIRRNYSNRLSGSRLPLGGVLFDGTGRPIREWFDGSSGKGLEAWARKP